MHIEVTPEELNYIRAALALVIFERDELIDTGRLAKELGEDATLDAPRESAAYEDAIRSILLKLPTP